MTDIRVTGIKTEVARAVASEARVTKVAAEVLVTESGAHARVSHMFIEVLRTGVSGGGGGGGSSSAPIVCFFGR